MVLHSLSELGKVFGVKPRERKPKIYHCKNCGCQMRRVGETNVYFCPGKNDEGVACQNRYIAPVLS